MTACYVGLDQSFGGFGISVLTDDWQQTQCKKFPAEKYGRGVDRLEAVYNYLSDFFRQLDAVHVVRHVCMEGYARGRNNWREEAGELGAVVKLSLRQSLGDPVCYPTIVVPTQVKKFATGKGTAAKNTILLAVYKKWGVEFQSDDEADAYTLARIARGFEAGVDLQYEKDVLAAVRPHPERPSLTNIMT